MALGLSTFAIDLNQMAMALKHATGRSLILADEFGKVRLALEMTSTLFPSSTYTLPIIFPSSIHIYIHLSISIFWTLTIGHRTQRWRGVGWRCAAVSLPAGGGALSVDALYYPFFRPHCPQHCAGKPLAQIQGERETDTVLYFNPFSRMSP